jgi:hypothetical protein
VQQLFAQGMLLTAAAALDLPAISGEEARARDFMGMRKGGTPANTQP